MLDRMTPTHADEPLDDHDAPPGRRQLPRRGYVLAVLALVASLLLVVGYWRSAVSREQRAAQTEFIADTDELAELLQQRLRNYELVTRGGVALFASVEQPSAGQWKDYVDGLDTQAQFPGLIGLGYGPLLDGRRLGELQQSLRAGGAGLFTIRPVGPRPRYAPVLYLEPTSARNASAIGYDMLSEPVRAAAMQAAGDDGSSRLTAPTQLVFDGGTAMIGLVMYTPIYGGRMPSTAASRRAALRGWVYVPLRVGEFVDAALAGRPRIPQLSISDVTDGTPRALYVDSRAGGAAGGFTRDVDLDVYGRRWRLEFSADAAAYVAARGSDLKATLGVGVLASLLIFGIALALARTEVIARRRAGLLSESYRLSERRFRNAMRYSAVGTALLDDAENIVEANPALAAILRTTPQALAGRPLSAYLLDPSRPAAAQAQPDGARRIMREVVDPDGQRRQLQLVYSPVEGRADEDIAMLLQVEDITERRRAEARERALNRTLEARVALRTRELTHTNRELESFAYSVSHDLRSPLRSIDGFSRVLQERHGEAIGAEGRDYLGRVRKAAARMDTLIDALLRISRVSRGTLEFAPLQLDAMATEIVEELRQTSPDRQVEVTIQPGMQAVGDPPLVRTLLENLIGNAWKFTGMLDAARIGIGVSATTDEMVECVVRDNGAGFEAEYADKLFRAFQRLHGQEEFAGHGIGLASVKRILERHGGTIRAEGKPDAGAAFYFTLPRRAPHE